MVEVGFGEEALDGVADGVGGGLAGVDFESGALGGEFAGEQGLVEVVVQGEVGDRLTLSAPASRLRCDSTTPFGLPVLPEV